MGTSDKLSFWEQTDFERVPERLRISANIIKGCQKPFRNESILERFGGEFDARSRNDRGRYDFLQRRAGTKC